MQIGEQGSGEGKGESKQAGLYQHGVKLALQGGYFPIMQFLEKIEQSGWQFYWQGFEYQVSEYPTATLELEVYTLSTSEAFIGV